MTVTDTAAMVTVSYSSALRASTTAWEIDAVSSAASASVSAAAVTVTVCAVSQLDGVKVSVFWLPDVPVSVSTVTSALPVAVTVITTSEAGFVSRTTV